MLKTWFRGQVNRITDSLVTKIVQHVSRREAAVRTGIGSSAKYSGVAKEMQILLQLRYREIQQNRLPLPSFDEVQLKSYSQSGEDGVLLYIFSLIGTTNRRCVEICAGNGIECNSANLIVHHNWHGLLFDGSEKNVKLGMEFYRANCVNKHSLPLFRAAWITSEGVNNLVSSNGFEGKVDLLTIDIDGNDYWVWEALDVVSPRVVVVEFQHSWGADHAVTQKYDPKFVWNPGAFPSGMAGASLPAFVKLGRRKGYRLVGVHSCNAFFVKNGLGDDVLPEIPAEDCFQLPMNKLQRARHLAYEKEHGSLIRGNWIEV